MINENNKKTREALAFIKEREAIARSESYNRYLLAADAELKQYKTDARINAILSALASIALGCALILAALDKI